VSEGLTWRDFKNAAAFGPFVSWGGSCLGILVPPSTVKRLSMPVSLQRSGLSTVVLREIDSWSTIRADTSPQIGDGESHGS
jgi:hypothetical protein